MKVLVYGTGKYYKKYSDQFLFKDEIVGYVDSNESIATSKCNELFEGKKMYTIEEAKKLEFDILYVFSGFTASGEILKRLMEASFLIPNVKFICLELFNIQYVCDYNKIIVCTDEIKLNIENYSDFIIFCEIYINNSYRVNMRHDNVVVIDAGMNVGYASLWFAKNKKVEKIYAFEPFNDTFCQAKKNIELNKNEIKDKIEMFQYGLSDKNSSFKFKSEFEESSYRNIINNCDDNDDGVLIETKKASDIIKVIKEKHLKSHFFLKMDVEGSEFDIIRDLEENKLIKIFDVGILEYHHNPNEIISIFEKNGFYVFSIGASNGIGMLYIVNMNIT